MRVTGSAAALVLGLAVAPVALAGQPLHGKVVDASTGEPIAGATVTVKGSPARASTDDLGHFMLKLDEGTWVVEVAKPPLISTNDTVVIAAGRAPDPIELVLIGEMESIKVVEFPKRLAVAPGGTQLVRDEILHVPGTRGDVLTVVQSLPGVANTGTFTPFSSGIIIRGSDPSDARILVDGFEIPLLYHFGAVQAILPSEMIEDVLYAPGAFGVEHGRASSGTIEVRSRSGKPQLGGFAELSFVNGSMFLQGPIGDPKHHATFAVSLRRSIIDAILPAVLPDDSDLAFTMLPRYYDWQARVDWQPRDRWKLSLFVFGTDDSTAFALDRQDPADPALSGKFSNRTRFSRGIATVTYDGERFTNRAALSLDTTRFSFDMSSDRHLRLKNEGVTARNETEGKLGERLTWRVGAEVMVQAVEVDEKMPRREREGDPSVPNFTHDPIVERKEQLLLPTVAAWTAVDVKMADHATLTAGMRYDGFLRNRAHVMQPRVELKLGLGHNTLRASSGLYSRPPYWEDEVVQADLQPERAWQSALGLERELRPGLTLQTTAFYNHRSDLISFDGARAEATPGSNNYVNQGEGWTYGGELLLTWRGPRHLAWMAYTLSRSLRQDGAGSPMRLFDFDQTHNLVLVGSRRFGKDDRWQIGGRFQLTTGKPYTPVVGSIYMSDLARHQPLYGPINSSRVETMHQLDLRLDRFWQFKTWRLSAYVDIQNVYLHAGVMDYRYSADFTERKPITTLPIVPSFGIRGEF